MAAALAALLLSASCTRSQKTAAGSGNQKTFASPDEAGAALVAAVRSGDQNALLAIFGPDSQKVLFTGDTATDKARLQDFASAYGQMHRWAKIKAGGQVLQAGPENTAFPVPLGQNASGRWYFDTAAGKDEILARRIGKNELTAMDASEAIAAAERQYFQSTHDGNKDKQYAQKLVSDPGRHNGLYWAAADGQPPSPLGQAGDFTKALSTAASDKPLLFNGYYYRILSKSGAPNGSGFVVIAYPAEYRNSGITSFLADENGTLYQKDLGEKTVEEAAAITSVNPGDGWNSVTTQTGTAARTVQ
jgi:hypothetical protein